MKATNSCVPICRFPKHPRRWRISPSLSTRRATVARCTWTGKTPAPAQLLKKRRSEEHTSELQSHLNLVCRLLLEKKKKQKKTLNQETMYRKNISIKNRDTSIT